MGAPSLVIALPVILAVVYRFGRRCNSRQRGARSGMQGRGEADGVIVPDRDVFLCHSGAEKRRIVSVIEDGLTRQATNSFLDIRDLVSGQTSEETIKPALLSARAVVIVVSLSFLERDYPMKELRWLLQGGKITKAVPVFYGLKRAECRKDALSCTVQNALRRNPSVKSEADYKALVADLDALVHCGNIDFDQQPSDAYIANWVVAEVKQKLGSASVYLPPEIQGIDAEVDRLAGLVKAGGFLGLYGPGFTVHALQTWTYAATGLPSGLCQLAALQQLDAIGCNMMYLPPLGIMAALRTLRLSGCECLQQLPDNLSELYALQQLELAGCRKLCSLPQLPAQLTLLKLGGCSVLTELAPISTAQQLQQLDLSRVQLQELPDSISCLTALQQLHMQQCSELQSFPPSISHLKALQLLDLEGCSALGSLPEQMGALVSMQYLCLRGCSSLLVLPDTLRNLHSLTELRLGGCSQQLHEAAAVGQMRVCRQDTDLQNLVVWGWAWQDLRKGTGGISHLAANELQEREQGSKRPLYFLAHGLTDATYRAVFVGPDGLRSAPGECTQHIKNLSWRNPDVWCEVSLEGAGSSSRDSSGSGSGSSSSTSRPSEPVSGVLMLQCSEFGGAFMDRASAQVQGLMSTRMTFVFST